MSSPKLLWNLCPDFILGLMFFGFWLWNFVVALSCRIALNVRNFCVVATCFITHSWFSLCDLFRRVFSYSFGHLLRKSLEVSALDFWSQYWSCIRLGKLLLARAVQTFVLLTVRLGTAGEVGRTTYTASPSWPVLCKPQIQFITVLTTLSLVPLQSHLYPIDPLIFHHFETLFNVFPPSSPALSSWSFPSAFGS